MSGTYDAEPIVKLLSDGRRVELVQDFGFIDARGQRWDVPSGAIVDGASIPQPLWSVIGGPFEGTYRNASIVHDWFCDIRSRPWNLVHRMFYDAMLASGVSTPRARLMFAGVYWGGPRWSPTVEGNVQLLLNRHSQSRDGSQRMFHMRSMPRSRAYRYGFSDADLKELDESLPSHLTLDDIERMIDQRLQPLARIEC